MAPVSGAICVFKMRSLAGQGVFAQRRPMTKATDRPSPPVVRIRIVFGADEMIGPGKAELLERIARTGSIAAAGREMGMSYKRAWDIVSRLNAMFSAPLVESSRGGAKGGGAVLTEFGQEIVSLYRKFQEKAALAGAEELLALQSKLSDLSGGK